MEFLTPYVSKFDRLTWLFLCRFRLSSPGSNCNGLLFMKSSTVYMVDEKKLPLYDFISNSTVLTDSIFVRRNIAESFFTFISRLSQEPIRFSCCRSNLKVIESTGRWKVWWIVWHQWRHCWEKKHLDCSTLSQRWSIVEKRNTRIEYGMNSTLWTGLLTDFSIVKKFPGFDQNFRLNFHNHIHFVN